MGLFDFMKKDEKRPSLDKAPGSFNPDSNSSMNNQASSDPFSSSSRSSPTNNPYSNNLGFNGSSPNTQGVQKNQANLSGQGRFSNSQEFSPFANNHDNVPSPIQSDTPFPDALHSKDDSMMNKNFEIILSKLDAIRMAIQNMDHRISAIESRLDSHKSEQSGQSQQSSETNNLF